MKPRRTPAVAFLSALLFTAACAGSQAPCAGGEADCPQRPDQWLDVSYAADTLTGHRMDIYLPQQGTAPYPVVVVIAGSGWFGNDTKERGYQILGVPLREAGFAVVAINHRSSREATFPAQIHDVKAAVRFIRANASAYRLAPGFIGITGNSSGGHLSALMGTTGGVEMHTIGEHTLPLEGAVGRFTDRDSRVDAVVDWFGPTTFQAMDACGSRLNHDAADSPESTLIGGPIQEHGALSALADPITYVDPTDPPFLILHGDADPLVPHCQSELLYRALQDKGVESTLVIVPGAGHGDGMWVDPYVGQMVRFFHGQRAEKLE